MVKLISALLFISMMLGSVSLSACDACGCGASSLGVGLLTNYKSNHFRLSYLTTRFSSNLDREFETQDNFRQLNLSMRYAVGKNKRVRLIAHVPYKMNIRESSDYGTQRIQGISDVKLIANYVLLKDQIVGSKSTFFLEAGAGLSLPTGKFDPSIHDDNLPENFNPGMGSLAYLFQVNTALSGFTSGVVFNSSYQINGKLGYGYHFGNQFTTQIVGFKEFELGVVKLIPNLGLSYENVSYDKYANGNTVEKTGGQGLYFSSAINFKKDKWLAGVSCSLPVKEYYSSNTVTAQERLSASLAFIF